MAFPYPHKIRKTMVEQGIPNETISKFEFPDSLQAEKIVSFISQMEEILTPKQCLSIIECQGCSKTGKSDKENRTFGLKYASKTIDERIKLLPESSIPKSVICHLNSNRTLSVFWAFGVEGNYKCVCSGIRKLTEPIKIPRTYCGCCGGHIRHHLQNALFVELHLKKILSSPNTSKGKKRCEFLFEVKEKA